MIDRNVEFPNRFRMTKVDGTDDIYDLIPAPGEVIAPGDTFSKANMLPDSIPAALGLKMANPQVKDALNVLAHVGNLHVWKRVQTYAEEQHTYTLGEKITGVALATGTGAGYQQIWYCSDKITVSDSLEISLVSPSTVNFYSNTTTEEFMSAVAGKFIKYKGHGSEAGLTLSYASVYFCPGDSAFGRVQYSQYAEYKGITNAQIVTAVTIPAGTTTDYLTSTDRNAYPDQSAEGGEPEIPAHYTLADAVTVDVLSSSADYNASVKTCDLNSIIVNNDGSISTTGFSVLRGGGNALTSPGSWVKFSPTEAYYITSGSSNVVFTDTIFTVSAETTLQYADGKYVLPGCRELIGHAKVEAIPPNTTITYLGQLGCGARIEVGSYVGTGTESADILIGFTPKAVIVSKYSYLGVESNYSAFILPGLPNEAKVKRAEIIDGGFRVYYYSSGTASYASYLNNPGDTYRYIAIG